MSQYLKGRDIRRGVYGFNTKKTLASVTNATQSLYTVTGLVILQGITGFVTTAMDGTTTSINLNHDPTIGSAANLCAATVVTSDQAGTVYGYLGDSIATLFVSSGTTAPGEAYAPLLARPQVITPGVIGLVGTAADAGVTDWYLLWVPLTDDGAVVAA